jgi:hypothetical protein
MQVRGEGNIPNPDTDIGNLGRTAFGRDHDVSAGRSPPNAISCGDSYTANSENRTHVHRFTKVAAASRKYLQ